MSAGVTPCVGDSVIGAAGGVNVMISRIPAGLGHVNPAFQVERFAMSRLGGNRHFAALNEIFRSAPNVTVYLPGGSSTDSPSRR